MQHLATLAGTGWLETPGAGSAIATYRVEIYRHTSGPERGQIMTRGVIAAEGWALAAAIVAGGAILSQETGEPLDIQVTRMGASDTTAIFIVTGNLPVV